MIPIITLNTLVEFILGDKRNNLGKNSLALIHPCFYRNTNQIEKSKKACNTLILYSLQGFQKT